MATLSRDGTTDYHAHGVIVRDARHCHNGPEVTGIGGAKNTKRWCRGKPRRQHVLVVRIIEKGTGLPSLVRHCTECGREFGVWYGPWENLPARLNAPPAWVTPERAASLMEARRSARARFEYQRR
jgi:hypothetical protein